MDFIIAHKAEAFGLLFAFSELLAAIPAVKANSVFQLAVSFLKMISGK